MANKKTGDPLKTSTDNANAMNDFLMMKAGERNNAEVSYRQNLELAEQQKKIAEAAAVARRARQQNEQRRQIMDQAIYPYKKGGPVTALNKVHEMYSKKNR